MSRFRNDGELCNCGAMDDTPHRVGSVAGCTGHNRSSEVLKNHKTERQLMEELHSRELRINIAKCPYCHGSHVGLLVTELSRPRMVGLKRCTKVCICPSTGLEIFG